MISLIQISSVENIMPKPNQNFTPISWLSILKGEKASYQLAFCTDSTTNYNIEFKSEIMEHLKIYKIGCVPVMRTVHQPKAMNDDGYISTESGMYPDILYPLSENTVRAQYFYQGIWIEIDENVSPGIYKIEATLSNSYESATQTLNLEVLSLELPKQELKYCIPVHADCLASYYNMEVFSEEHWNMLEKFIRYSADYGSNMLVPPIFTPPVDTEVNGERLTVQLTDIYKDGDKYTFDFSKFERYIKMCQDAGIKYFYMPPFFTQWGAEFTPKIIAIENGEEKRIFGWDVKSTDEKYLNFLSQFLPALSDNLKKLGIEKDVMFSISDEPFGEEAVKRYGILAPFLKKCLPDYTFIDAFSDYEHFKNSGATIPLIPTSAFHKRFEGKVSDLNVYYCCAEDYKLSNRFIAMPLYRNRCFGYQLYKYDVKCFFHWALNFYNAQLSTGPINPFVVTDSSGGFPAGDAFSVYPAEDGPIPSMRFIVFNEALQDLQALKLLESYVGRDEVIRLLENITGDIRFDNCAKNAQIILDIRTEMMLKFKELAQ